MPSEKVSGVAIYALTEKELRRMAWQWLVVGMVIGFAGTLCGVGVVSMVVANG